MAKGFTKEEIAALRGGEPDSVAPFTEGLNALIPRNAELHAFDWLTRPLDAAVAGWEGGRRISDASTKAKNTLDAASQGIDPSGLYGQWALAQGVQARAPVTPGTENVLAPLGTSTVQERLQNLPAWVVQEFARSIRAHPRQQIATLVGGVGGGLAGGLAGGVGAIPGAIVTGSVMGAEFGGPEYAGDITGAALEGGAYPGAGKIGGRDLNKGAIEGAGYTSALLDSGSGVAAFAAPAAAPVKSFLAKAALKVGEGAAIEGGTEAVQQVLQNIAIGDPLEKDVVQSAAAGVILGGVLGGMGSIEIKPKKKTAPEDPEGIDAIPVDPGTPPSGFNDSVLIPETPPKLSTSPEVESEAETEFDPQSDIERASRYAEAQMHAEDVFGLDELDTPGEGISRSVEPAEAYRTQRLSEEEGIEAARQDIQSLMEDEGVDFPTAMKMFKERGDHERLGRLISPTVHSNPFRDDDEVVPAVKVIDRDASGKVVRESIHTIPEGKTLQDYADRFAAAPKTDTNSISNRPASKPTPAPDEAGFYSLAQDTLNRTDRKNGKGAAWLNEFKRRGVKKSDLPHIGLGDIDPAKNYSRADIEAMVATKRGIEVEKLRGNPLAGNETRGMSYAEEAAYLKTKQVPQYANYSISNKIEGAQDYGEDLLTLTGSGPGSEYRNEHFEGREGLVSHNRHFKMPDGSYVVEENQSFLHQAARDASEGRGDDLYDEAKSRLEEANEAITAIGDAILELEDLGKEVLADAQEEGAPKDLLNIIDHYIETARDTIAAYKFKGLTASYSSEAYGDISNELNEFEHDSDTKWDSARSIGYKINDAINLMDEIDGARLEQIEAQSSFDDASKDLKDLQDTPLADNYTEATIQSALMQAVKDPETTGFYHVGPEIKNGDILKPDEVQDGMRLHYSKKRDAELNRIAKQFGLRVKDKILPRKAEDLLNAIERGLEDVRLYENRLERAIRDAEADPDMPSGVTPYEINGVVYKQNTTNAEIVPYFEARLQEHKDKLEELEVNGLPPIKVRGFDLTPEQKAQIAAKGFPLLKAGERVKGAPLSIAERQWLRGYARKYLDDLGMPDIKFDLPSELDGGGLAEFDPMEQLISIATAYLPEADVPLDQAVRDLLNHEIIHAVLNVDGAIDEARWQSIKNELTTSKPTQKQLDRMGWRREGVDPTKTWMQNIRIQFPEYSGKYYQKVAKSRARVSNRPWVEELHDIQIEEAIAEFSLLYGKRNDDIPAFLRPLVARIFKLLKPVVKAARAFAKRIGADRRSELQKFVAEVHDGEFPIDDLTEAKKAGILQRVADAPAPEGEYSDVPEVTIVPRGFFSAVEQSWKTISARDDLPETLPLYKWIQRMQKVHKEFRPRKAELDYIFKGVPLDAPLGKDTVSQIIALNKLELNRNYSTDQGTEGEDGIRPVGVRLPGATSEKYESVMSLPPNVPGGDFIDSHQNRAPIFVTGAYVSTLGEIRPVVGADGAVYKDADFIGQIQSDLVQGLQDTESMDKAIESLRADVEINKTALKGLDPKDQYFYRSQNIIRNEIERLTGLIKELESIETPQVPLAETERFVRIALADAMTRAAANGREVIAVPYGNTVDMVQRGGSRYLADIRQSVARLEAALAKAEATGNPDLIEDAKSDLKPVKETLARLERRINFYSETVKNAAEKMARRIGATVEIGRVPFEKKDNKLKITATGQKMVDALGFAESLRLQQIAKQIASIINQPGFNRADFVQAVQGYEATAEMLGDKRSAAKANLLSNDLTLNSVTEKVGGSVDQGLAVIIKLNPDARTKIIRDGFPLFAARKGPAKPRHNPPGMRFGASVNPDPGTNEVLPHIGGYIEDVISVRDQQAAANDGPKMLNKPIVGGVVDYASQVGEKGLRSIWSALKIDGMFKWYTPFGNIKDSSTWEMLRMISQGRVAQIEAVAAKEFKILSSREDKFEEILDYLMTAPGRDIEITNIDTGETSIHSEQRALERIGDLKLQAAAVKAKKALNELGQMLVDHGFIDKGQYEKFKGSYLPGMYAKYIESYRTPTGIRMSGVPYRYSKKGPKVSREGTGSTDPNSKDLIVPGSEIDSGGVDYTITGLGPTDKALLGEIKDPGILVTHAIVRGMRDLAMANLLNGAVHHSATSPTNPKWVLPQTMVVYGGKPMSLWEFANEKDRIEQQLNEEKDRLWRLRENTSFQYEVLGAELKWMDDVLSKSRFKEIYLKGELPDDYKMVPKDPTRYGDMAGAIVRKEIYHDLMNSFAVFNPEEGTIGQQIQATQRKLLNTFKIAKTVLSLGGQARQAYSNIMMVGLAGANPAVRVPQAVQQIIDHYMLGKTSPAMKAALEGGQTAATLTKAELRMMDELQRKLQDAGKSGRFWNSSPTMAPALRVVKMLREVAAKTGNIAGAAYQLTDTIGKLAIVIDEMDRGQPPLIAAHKARKWFGDYSAVPPVIRSARESGMAPFITYFYITLPNMVETMATRPWTFWPYYATGVLMAGAAGAMLNGDDDDEVTWMGFNFDERSMANAMNPFSDPKNTSQYGEGAKNVPLEEAAKRTSPEYMAQDKFATVLPVRDSYGRPQMMTTKPLFAFSPIPEAARAATKGEVWKAMQAAGLNGGPAFAIGSVMTTGIEPGLGRKIWDEKDPQEVRNARTIMFMLNQFTPPEVQNFSPPGNSIPLFSLFPGAEGVEAGRGWNAIQGRGVNKKGDPTWDASQMWLREAGITLTPLDISKARRDRLKYEYDDPITDLRREIKAMNDRPDIDPKVRAENVADMEKRLNRLEEERQQFKFDTARIVTVEVENQRRLKSEQR